MHTRSRLVPLLLTVALGSLLAGCGDGTATDPASTSSSPSATQTSSSAPATGSDAGDETDAPPFPANAEPDSAEASADARVTVSDIRIGRHDGFDRVVFEVGGTGTPGWDVRYVDQASSQGSGDAVEVAGAAVLQVTLTGAGYPYDTGVEEWSGPDPLASGDTETVTELVFDATFEGTTVSFVGTTGRVPFRVYLLDEPTRVVVDLADAR